MAAEVTNLVPVVCTLIDVIDKLRGGWSAMISECEATIVADLAVLAVDLG